MPAQHSHNTEWDSDAESSSETTASDEDEGDVDVGTEVKKVFGDQPFTGVVVWTDVDDDGKTLYHIMYEDGDEEDLHYSECKLIKV